MSDRERRILRLEEWTLDLQRRTASAEIRAAAVEQSRWQRVRGAGADDGGRTWVLQLIGCFGLPLDGETVQIVDSFGSGSVLGSGVTDSSGVAVFTTYGGDSSGNVQFEATVSRFDALSVTLNAAPGSTTFHSETLSVDASHVPGTANDPRPWGLTATLFDNSLGATVSLTYAGFPTLVYSGGGTGGFAGGGGCAALASVPVSYNVDLNGGGLGSPAAQVLWFANGGGCPAASGTLKTDTLGTIASTPGTRVATFTGLVGTSKLYPSGSPTYTVTGT